MGDMRMYQDERRLDFHALGREIKRKREAKGWTQEYLAQLVDRTPRSIMYFENQVICLRHRSLSLLFLFVLAVRDTQQMVDIGLDRHGLPHFLLCRAVLGIERLFPRRQLAAFSF